MNFDNLYTDLQKQTSWIDELIKWENAHPKQQQQPFPEDSDSQRQVNLKENY